MGEADSELSEPQPEPQYLPAVDAAEIGFVVDALRKAQVLAQDPTSEESLNEEDAARVERFPLMPGNNLEIRMGEGKIERSTIKGVPHRLESNTAVPGDWVVPVTLESGPETAYHVYALGILDKGGNRSVNRAIITKPQTEAPQA
ncbi:MAG TPA: hypothetical protein VNA13_04700 [Xanthomonadales bacterium]|nr:hypothetical protein [Xanthomonadales bacterium]